MAQLVQAHVPGVREEKLVIRGDETTKVQVLSPVEDIAFSVDLNSVNKSCLCLLNPPVIIFSE